MQEELNILIQAQYPLIYLVTAEEDRAEGVGGGEGLISSFDDQARPGVVALDGVDNGRLDLKGLAGVVVAIGGVDVVGIECAEGVPKLTPARKQRRSWFARWESQRLRHPEWSVFTEGEGDVPNPSD